jgi:acetyl-CoA carboxylase carboxyltransferase component
VFNQVDYGDTSFNPIFRAWGDSIRVGMLQLQGRPTNVLATKQ